ncbi:hypothetical protein C8N46_103482 [Kordia periserrulae]|uniref:Uncharacterized protein n=1 Tax=Kordia periserrulae TaxID=701523 RepID=A0A2T6C236_9FLAO|nr:hypothetical protein [Kordia periserrulae]PTX62381.1 hypothetical protein C8N46_103482 [Kordia periserrulae]
MKKRELKNLILNKTSISNLDESIKGGALPHSEKDCANDTGCIGPVKETCGIINCQLLSDIGCEEA